MYITYFPSWTIYVQTVNITGSWENEPRCYHACLIKHDSSHSRPQRPRSFWSAPGIETSGRLQNRKSAIHGLIVKYDKSDWLKNTERVLCACSEIGSGQRSRFLAQTRRIAASGDENGLFVHISFRTPFAVLW